MELPENWAKKTSLNPNGKRNSKAGSSQFESQGFRKFMLQRVGGLVQCNAVWWFVDERNRGLLTP